LSAADRDKASHSKGNISEFFNLKELEVIHYQENQLSHNTSLNSDLKNYNEIVDERNKLIKNQDQHTTHHGQGKANKDHVSSESKTRTSSTKQKDSTYCNNQSLSNDDPKEVGNDKDDKDDKNDKDQARMDH